MSCSAPGDRPGAVWQQNWVPSGPPAPTSGAALVPGAERLFGAEHEEALHLRRGVATQTGEVGDASAALAQLTAMLPEVERALGADSYEAFALGWTWPNGPAGPATRPRPTSSSPRS